MTTTPTSTRKRPMNQPLFTTKSLDKFSMSAPAPGVENRRSRLVWQFYRGNPRITVWTGLQGDNTPINAAMNPETFFAMLAQLEQMSHSSQETKAGLKCFTLPRVPEGQKRTPEQWEKILQSTVYYGRDANGMLWISVVAENRPKIKFEFNISDYHCFLKSDGAVITPQEASSLQCQSVIRALREIAAVQASEFRDPGNAENTHTSEKSTVTTATPVQSGNFDDISF